jgi:AraC-like DNA-binding protein
MRTPGTSGMVLLRGLVHAATAAGVDRAELLARVGVNEAELAADASVPTVALAQAWQTAPALSGDPLFGLHASEHAELGSYDIIDYLFLTSATLGDACRALERYHRIVVEIWRVELVVEGADARFRLWVPADVVEPLRHAWDYFFAGALKRIRRALPPGVSPREVHLMHAAPTDPREYERVPSDQDLLVRARTLLPVLLKDPELSLRNLAEQLGVGERTLQRKLAEHGLTYKRLVDQAREEHAVRALEGGALTVQELAYELGFQSTAAFSRAFRRWRGMAPSDWVREHARRVRSTH